MTGTCKAFPEDPQLVQLEQVVENKTRSLPFEPLFPSAAQVLFTPLWDASTGSFGYACFVAAAVETTSFCSAVELRQLLYVLLSCSRLPQLESTARPS